MLSNIKDGYCNLLFDVFSRQSYYDGLHTYELLSHDLISCMYAGVLSTPACNYIIKCMSNVRNRFTDDMSRRGVITY